MNEEQIKQKFKETYPDFMRGDEPLSPYFDIWEYGIELATKELQQDAIDLLKDIDDINKQHEEEVNALEAQIEKMKSDIKQLREDRMNDDTDQNIMDRLWEEWNVNFGVSN